MGCGLTATMGGQKACPSLCEAYSAQLEARLGRHAYMLDLNWTSLLTKRSTAQYPDYVLKVALFSIDQHVGSSLQRINVNQRHLIITCRSAFCMSLGRQAAALLPFRTGDVPSHNTLTKQSAGSRCGTL